MPLILNCSETQRRVMALIEPDHDGVPITDRLADAVEQRPELGHWDWMLEVRGRMPAAVPWNLQRLQDLLDHPQCEPHTVVVTTDPVVEAWARLLSSSFRARRYWVAASWGAAVALLDIKPEGRLMPFREDAVKAWK